MKAFLMTAAVLFTAGNVALAEGTGAQGYFELHNDTENNVLVGFYTNDGNGWSENWIAGAQIEPGSSGTAEFGAESGACDQQFAAGWLGADGSEVVDDPFDIDVCEATNVYLGDNEITFD